MGERENILGRIHEALSVCAPPPGHGDSRPGAFAPGSSPAAKAREWLPLAGTTFDERLALFRKNSTALKTDFRLLDNQEQLEGQMLALREAEGWKTVASHAGKWTDRACRRLDLPVCRTDQGYDVHELEKCDVGITECDALIAQTGSVLVTARSAGGRALSVLPPHHVVIAHREQLLGDLPEAFALLRSKYAPNYPSFISLITGPSRTGDIERILVLGAHGPKKLTVVCA